MIQRIWAFLVATAVAVACSSGSGDGGSRTDFIECEGTADCPEGSCIEAQCDPAILPDEQAADITGRACSSADDCESLECDTLLGMCVADCRDPSRSCHAPFVCKAAGGTYTCNDPEPAPSCDGTPDGQVIPFTTVRQNGTGPALHWLTDDCVEVTYSPEVGDVAYLIEGAVREWNDVTCSTFCLSVPRQESRPPDYRRGEARIHFMGDAEIPVDQPALTTVYFSETTGRLFSAIVTIAADRTERSQLTTDDYLRELGLAMGLGSNLGEQAVMGTDFEPAENQFDAPTELDEEAFCTLYATEPYCR